jgi:hypothetical protein
MRSRAISMDGVDNLEWEVTYSHAVSRFNFFIKNRAVAPVLFFFLRAFF